MDLLIPLDSQHPPFCSISFSRYPVSTLDFHSRRNAMFCSAEKDRSISLQA